MLFRFIPFGVAPECVPFRYGGGTDELLLRIARATERIAARLEPSTREPSSLRPPDVPLMLDVTEVARWLRLTPKGVYGLIESGRIPHVKVGGRVRFEREAVLRWLGKSRVSPIGDRR